MAQALTQRPAIRRVGIWQTPAGVPINGIRYTVVHNAGKRLFDILFSSTVLLLSVPMILLIAAIIKWTSPGPVFFSHERIGRGGRKFRCHKFRTMYVDAQERLDEILTSDPALADEWEKTHKLKNDPRVSPIGSILRKTSLDEWPQFYNVFKGELSVVGPRAVEYVELTKHFGKKAAKILSIRPGLTGIWQTSGRNDTTYAQRVNLDEQYVDKRSFKMDLLLIVKTIPAMIFSKGAY